MKNFGSGNLRGGDAMEYPGVDGKNNIKMVTQ
jgi:hypothetical protein